MRVLTMNIFGRRADWRTRRRLLHETFARLDPDLVALQEAVVTEGHDQVADVVGGQMHLLLFVNHLPDWQLDHEHEREP